jgi:hypothetical protein
MVKFIFHVSEKTMRKIISDPALPANPTFEDVRAALLRLEQLEQREASPPQSKP